MKYLSDEQMENEMDYYIDNVKVKYAVLINGKWGCGKTTFVKKYLSKKDRKNFFPIYISLNGLNNIKDVKNKLLVSCIKNKSLKGILPFVDTALSITLGTVEEEKKLKGVQAIAKTLHENLKVPKHLLIFFDDLERCKIDISEILGYINDLVEHNDSKVVIVADEDKIDKKPYLEIKEKLIGKVLYYKANFNSIYDIFVNEILSNKDAENTARNNKSKLLDLLSQYNHFNLRTVQFILQSFDRLVNESLNVIDLTDLKDKYLDDLFTACVIVSIFIKNGKYSNNWKSDSNFGEINISINEEILELNYCFDFKFVDEYLINSVIDKNEIKNTLESYKKYCINKNKNPNDPLYKLEQYWCIPEKKLKEILQELYLNIKNNKYSLNSYSKIVIILSSIQELNVLNDIINDVINALKDNIKNKKVNGEFKEDLFLLKRNSEKYEIYEKNIKDIRELLNNYESNDIKDILFNIVLNIENWGENIKEYCRNNENIFMEKKRFLSLLKVELIVENIRNGEIEQIYEFWSSLQFIYRYANIKEIYCNDINDLKQFIKSLKSLTINDGVKKYAINNMCDYLNTVVNLLEEK